MCNHYRNHPEAIDTWREYIGWDQPADVEPFSEVKIDVFPKGMAMLGRTIEGRPTLDVMRWGVPRTLPGARPGTTRKSLVTNVRNLDSNFWRSMLKNPAQRCVVPFAEFAEPTLESVPEFGRKGEWWFSMTDGRRGGFAGIWRYSEEAGGNVFAFLTCEPNDVVRPHHPKAMPVILHDEDFGRWMTEPWDDVRGLATACPTQLMATPRLANVPARKVAADA